MAANEYVQAAAGHLQTAATALKSEMDQLRADYMTFERQANHDINDREGEVRALKARMLTIGEAPEGHQILLQIKRLSSEIGRLKDELKSRRMKLDGDLKGKEGQMNDLMNQSRNLQNKAGSLK